MFGDIQLYGRGAKGPASHGDGPLHALEIEVLPFPQTRTSCSSRGVKH